MAMIAAATQSTTTQNGGHHRVLATNSNRGDHDEDRSDDALGDDHLRPAVGDGEADVDRGDEHQSQRIYGRRIEPPERKW
jgi:hypothetical protein